MTTKTWRTPIIGFSALVLSVVVIVQMIRMNRNSNVVTYKGRSVAAWRGEFAELRTYSTVPPDSPFINAPDPDAIPLFRQLIHDDDARVRHLIVFYTRHLGRAGAPLSDDVIQLLDDPKKYVVVTAILALGAIESDSEKVTRLIFRFLRDEDIGKRLAALEVYVSRNIAEKDIIDNIMEILIDPSLRVYQSDAAKVLCRCDIRNRTARETIQQALTKEWDTKGLLQSQLAEAAGSIPPVDAPEIIEVLRNLLQNKKALVRVHAACSYFQLTGDYETTLPLLLQTDFNDPEILVCERLIETLAVIARKNKKAVDGLVLIAQKHALPVYREMALNELRKIAPERMPEVP